MTQEPINIESFDGFVIIRANSDPVGDELVNAYLVALQEEAKKGASIIFLDWGPAKSLNLESLTLLNREISQSMATYKFELVMVGEPELSATFQSSALAPFCQVFERGEKEVRKAVSRTILQETSSQLRSRMDVTMDDAIQVALKRWIGQPPLSVASAAVEINPSTDVISFAHMNVDGFEFRVFLSSSQCTMRTMLQQILNIELDKANPAIADGASELLNYLVAFFKQQLSTGDSLIETEPPQMLAPDEMMVLVENSPMAQHVQTNYGSFDVWLEMAA